MSVDAWVLGCILALVFGAIVIGPAIEFREARRAQERASVARASKVDPALHDLMRRKIEAHRLAAERCTRPWAMQRHIDEAAQSDSSYALPVLVEGPCE